MSRSPEAVVDPVLLGLAFTEIVTGTQPAVGSGFSFANDSRFASRLLAISFRFVTSAVAANRSVHVDTDDGGGNVVTRDGSGAVQLAGTAALYSFSVQRGAADWDQNNLLYVPLTGRWMEGPQNVLISVASIDAGDQLSQIVMLWERLHSDEPARR
jgi:hypothetical protein